MITWVTRFFKLSCILINNLRSPWYATILQRNTRVEADYDDISLSIWRQRLIITQEHITIDTDNIINKLYDNYQTVLVSNHMSYVINTVNLILQGCSSRRTKQIFLYHPWEGLLVCYWQLFYLSDLNIAGLVCLVENGVIIG